jgi:hypothetical protein
MATKFIISNHFKCQGFVKPDCNSDTAEGWKEGKRATAAFGGWFRSDVSIGTEVGDARAAISRNQENRSPASVALR